MLQGYFGTECNEKLIQSFFFIFPEAKTLKSRNTCYWKMIFVYRKTVRRERAIRKKQQHHNVNLHQLIKEYNSLNELQTRSISYLWIGVNYSISVLYNACIYQS